jgi:hypothetical protein
LVQGSLVAGGNALAERWPFYGRSVAELGVRMVAATPLGDAGGAVGSLVLFDPVSGRAQHDFDRANSLGHAVLCLALEAFCRSGWPGDLRPADFDCRALLHQAAGMIAEQRRCSMPTP